MWLQFVLQFDEEVIAWTCNGLQKKMSDSLRYCNKITQKFKYLKLLKDQKILKNQMIHYLEIIETKQNIYMTKQ